jgi:hypothetical protein
MRPTSSSRGRRPDFARRRRPPAHGGGGQGTTEATRPGRQREPGRRWEEPARGARGGSGGGTWSWAVLRRRDHLVEGGRSILREAVAGACRRAAAGGRRRVACGRLSRSRRETVVGEHGESCGSGPGGAIRVVFFSFRWHRAYTETEMYKIIFYH